MKNQKFRKFLVFTILSVSAYEVSATSSNLNASTSQNDTVFHQNKVLTGDLPASFKSQSGGLQNIGGDLQSSPLLSEAHGHGNMHPQSWLQVVESFHEEALEREMVKHVSTKEKTEVDMIPLPSAGWLFFSALIGFITLSNRRRV